METEKGDEDFSGDRLGLGVHLLGLAPQSRPFHQVVHNEGGGSWNSRLGFVYLFDEDFIWMALTYFHNSFLLLHFWLYFLLLEFCVFLLFRLCMFDLYEIQLMKMPV